MQNRKVGQWEILSKNTNGIVNEYKTQNGDITSILTTRTPSEEILEISFNSEESRKKFEEHPFNKKFGRVNSHDHHPHIMGGMTTVAIYNVGLIRRINKEDLVSMLVNEYPQISDIEKLIVQDLNATRNFVVRGSESPKRYPPNFLASNPQEASIASEDTAKQKNARAI